MKGHVNDDWVSMLMKPLAQVHPFLKTQLTFKYQEDSHGIIVVFG
jgi:hypothetical protein